jgi:UDP-N-acetylglucosamine 3-dehydrogenase
MTTFKVALVGLGEIAEKRYARLIKRNPAVQLAAVCSRRAETAQAFAAAHGAARWTADFDTIANDRGIDAVIVTTPHPTHAPLAVAALRAGKHVLIEKPLATSFEDAQAVVRAAKESDKVTMALPFDAKPWMLAVVDVLRGGAIGKIVGLAIDQAGPGPPASRAWKYRRDQAGGGVLLGHGVYGLSVIASLMGPAQAVSAETRTVFSERAVPSGQTIACDIEDACLLSLRFASRQLVHLASSWTSQSAYETITIHGSHGTIVVTSGQVWLRRGAPRGGESGAVENARPGADRSDDAAPMRGFEPVPTPRGLGGIVDHFVDCMRHDRRPWSSIEQAVHVTETIVRAYESSARGGVVVPLVTQFEPSAQLPRELFDLSITSSIQTEVPHAVD